MKNKEDEKNQLLMLLFSASYILKNSDDQFSKLLYTAYQKIEEGQDYKIICSRISYDCNQYVLKHMHYIPKPVGQLNTLVQEISKRYRLKVGSVFNRPLYEALKYL